MAGNAVNLFQKAHIKRHISFINDKAVSSMNIQSLRVDQIQNAPRRTDYQLRLFALQLLNLMLLVGTPNVIVNRKLLWCKLIQLLGRIIDLVGQFTTGRGNYDLYVLIFSVQLLKNRQQKSMRLTAPGLGLTNHALIGKHDWNHFFLNRCRLNEMKIF